MSESLARCLAARAYVSRQLIGVDGSQSASLDSCSTPHSDLQASRSLKKLSRLTRLSRLEFGCKSKACIIPALAGLSNLICLCLTERSESEIADQEALSSLTALQSLSLGGWWVRLHPELPTRKLTARALPIVCLLPLLLPQFDETILPYLVGRRAGDASYQGLEQADRTRICED